MHDDNYWKEAKRAVVSSRPIATPLCCAILWVSGWHLYDDYVSRAVDAWSVAWHIILCLSASGGLLAVITADDESPVAQKPKV